VSINNYFINNVSLSNERQSVTRNFGSIVKIEWRKLKVTFLKIGHKEKDRELGLCHFQKWNF